MIVAKKEVALFQMLEHFESGSRIRLLPNAKHFNVERFGAFCLAAMRIRSYGFMLDRIIELVCFCFSSGILRERIHWVHAWHRKLHGRAFILVRNVSTKYMLFTRHERTVLIDAFVDSSAECQTNINVAYNSSKCKKWRVSVILNENLNTKSMCAIQQMVFRKSQIDSDVNLSFSFWC